MRGVGSRWAFMCGARAENVQFLCGHGARRGPHILAAVPIEVHEAPLRSKRRGDGPCAVARHDDARVLHPIGLAAYCYMAWNHVPASGGECEKREREHTHLCVVVCSSCVSGRATRRWGHCTMNLGQEHTQDKPTTSRHPAIIMHIILPFLATIAVCSAADVAKTPPMGFNTVRLFVATNARSNPHSALLTPRASPANKISGTFITAARTRPFCGPRGTPSSALACRRWATSMSTRT